MGSFARLEVCTSVCPARAMEHRVGHSPARNGGPISTQHRHDTNNVAQYEMCCGVTKGEVWAYFP